MSLFNYKVKDKTGKNLKGIIEAANEKKAVEVLREQGHLIISISPRTESLTSTIQKIFARINSESVVDFTRQLSTMINAGLPLTESLVILRDQTKNPALTQVLDDLLKEVQGGASLSSALENYPQIFSKVYIALIRSGEAAGVLDKVTLRLADNLEKEREFKSKTKGALIYPAIICIAMVAVMGVMMVFVFPKLTAMYKDFNAKLPASTMFLMQLSDFSVRFFPLILVLIIVAVFIFRNFSRTESGRFLIDKIVFRLPLIGPLQKEVALTEFTRTLGLLIGTGIPIIDGLNIVAEAVGNSVYRKAIKEAAVDVEKGIALAIPISQNPDFPSIVGQMIKVGEESGKMDEVLLKLSKFFESEAEHLIKGLTTAIEPLIMIILGIGVGFLVISVLMPIYNLTSQF